MPRGLRWGRARACEAAEEPLSIATRGKMQPALMAAAWCDLSDCRAARAAAACE